MKCPYLYIAPLFLILSTPVQAAANLHPDSCRTLARTAYLVMEAHQKGDSLRVMLDYSYQYMPADGGRKYTLAITRAAFSRPAYFTYASKKSAMQQFAEEQLFDCLENRNIFSD